MHQSISINPVILSGNELFCTFWAKLQLDDVLLGVGLKFKKKWQIKEDSQKIYDSCYINGNIFKFSSVEKEKEKQVSKS